MLTSQQISNELKITWDLDDAIARDPAEFAALTVIPEDFSPRQASFYFLGERSVPLVEWKGLVSSLQPLLEKRLKLQFICTSPKIAGWLQEMGVSLLGEVRCDPAAKESSLSKN